MCEYLLIWGIIVPRANVSQLTRNSVYFNNSTRGMLLSDLVEIEWELFEIHQQITGLTHIHVFDFF